jgi:ribosomal protein S18 acetylase RimI-like enzyme
MHFKCTLTKFLKEGIMSEIKIRRVKKRDEESVNNLLQVFANSNSKKIVDDKVLNLLAKGRSNFYAAVAIIEKNGKEKIVGFGTINFGILPDINGFFGKIEDVVVDVNYQNQGIGTKLCKHLIAIAKVFQMNGVSVKQIELTSNPKRIAAHKLYEKLGFKKKETDVLVLKLES